MTYCIKKIKYVHFHIIFFIDLFYFIMRHLNEQSIIPKSGEDGILYIVER